MRTLGLRVRPGERLTSTDVDAEDVREHVLPVHLGRPRAPVVPSREDPKIP